MMTSNSEAVSVKRIYPAWNWTCWRPLRVVTQLLVMLAVFGTVILIFKVIGNTIVQIIGFGVYMLALVALFKYGDDTNFERGAVPKRILKRMAVSFMVKNPELVTKHHSMSASRSWGNYNPEPINNPKQTILILDTIYRKAALLTPKDIKNTWTSNQAFSLGAKELIHTSEKEDWEYIRELCKHVLTEYYIEK